MIWVLLYMCVLQAAAIIVTDSPPTTEYNYWYDISDPSTGGGGSQETYRLGDIMKGSYSALDLDGTKHIVDYIADSKNGFKVVGRTGPLSTPTNNYNHPSSHVRYTTPKAYLHSTPWTEFYLPASVNNNLIQRVPVFFTPGSDGFARKPTFNRGEFFMPNYVRK